MATTTVAPVRIVTLPPVPPARQPRPVPPLPATRSYLPATDADDCARGPIVVMRGLTTDPARRALDVTDDTAVIDGPADDLATDGRRCDTCRGYGLVRAAGKRAGEHYRSHSGAQAAMANGNAADCPTCAGLGLVM